MTTDEDLVGRARAGDQHAFDALIDRHADHVYAICLRYFRNAADAEDAFQAAFLAFYRGLSSFTGHAALSTWLYRVTTNACHDIARRRSRRPRTVTLDDERGAAAVDASDPSAVDRLVATELRADLVEALRQVDGAQRHAVLLRDVVGASYADIAAAQGVAVGTAKSRVHRGHARLAELLRPTHGPGADIEQQVSGADRGNQVDPHDRPTVD